MIVVASANGSIGIGAAWRILQAGGTALDAVEAATRLVEDHPADHGVGYGGYPNVVGEVELDASIMDGTTRRAGAVGALRGYRHAISVARRVMEELPHVMLVGEGAARFAGEVGMKGEDLLTDEAHRAWRQGIQDQLPERWLKAGGGITEAVLRRAAAQASANAPAKGTVNFVAQDQAGRLASAVSTSGWPWKYPGRLGDSPIIGAGNYADDRYGAVALTGWGELAVRAGTARSVVLFLQAGKALDDACTEALHDLATLGVDGEAVSLSLVALDRGGHHCAMTTAPASSYVYQATGMPGPATLPSRVVNLREGGG